MQSILHFVPSASLVSHFAQSNESILHLILNESRALQHHLKERRRRNKKKQTTLMNRKNEVIHKISCVCVCGAGRATTSERTIRLMHNRWIATIQSVDASSPSGAHQPTPFNINHFNTQVENNYMFCIVGCHVPRLA